MVNQAAAVVSEVRPKEARQLSIGDLHLALDDCIPDQDLPDRLAIQKGELRNHDLIEALLLITL